MESPILQTEGKAEKVVESCQTVLNCRGTDIGNVGFQVLSIFERFFRVRIQEL